MSEPFLTIRMVRELRGSPLTVLVAILLLEQSGQVPVTAQLLKDVTGFRDHTITDSLRALTSATRQIVVRVNGGWRLATGFQLPLEIQNRENRDSDPTTATTRLEGTGHVLSAAEEDPAQNREFRDSLTAEQETIRTILKTEGLIGEPTCTRLARMDGMDPLYVMAHCAKAAIENSGTSLLVHRIRSRDHVEEIYRRRAQERLMKLEAP